mgnify:FL=1
MSQNPLRLRRAPFVRSLALLIALPAFAATAEAGPFNAPVGVATPSIPNTNFAKLKQTSGFTGQLSFGYSDGGYTPIGTSFNELIDLRFSVNCPANYRVHEAGIRVRGNDVNNYDYELVSPGDVPFDQNSWQQDFESQPWKFDAVQQAGAQALQAANNNGPVYVSLDKELDSRIEFYASCSASQPSSGLPFLYYDSATDNGHLRPMTRVRYQVMATVAVSPKLQLKSAPQATQPSRLGERLRHRDRAAVQPNTLPPLARPQVKAPGGCPYDCPPPARSLRLSN